MNSKLLKDSCGFTLIELLVVLAIIAILAVIAIINYTGLEMRARDSSRRTYLTELAQALEVNKGPESYVSLQANQLSELYSADPGGNVYCIATNSSTPDPSFAVPWGGTCPAGFDTVASGAPVGNFTSFKVCTYLEQPGSNGTNVYCKSGSL